MKLKIRYRKPYMEKFSEKEIPVMKAIYGKFSETESPVMKAIYGSSMKLKVR